MAIDKINSWLNSDRNFNEGRELYNQYGESDALKKIFAASGPTEWNIEKLAAELEKISSQFISKPSPEKKRVNRIHEKIHTVDKNDLPAEVQELKKQKHLLYNEAAMLKNTLAAMDINDRVKAIARIRSNFVEIDAIYRSLDQYEKTKSITRYIKEDPGIVIPPAEDKLALRTFITNNRSNISKAKKRKQLEKMNAFIAAGEEAQRRFNA